METMAGFAFAVVLLARPAIAGPVVERPVQAAVSPVSGVPTTVQERTIADLTAPSTVLPAAAIPDGADGVDEAVSEMPDASPQLAVQRTGTAMPARSAIEKLAQGAASEAAFDGSAPLWSESMDGEAPRVRSLGVRDDRLLINGREPRELGSAVVRGGVSERILIHPDDPGLVVHVLHDPDALGGFESQTGKVERLAPLAAASAAAELIEYGDASIPGFGRVHFFVQKLLPGAKLSELPGSAWPVRAMERLFERLRGAGLKLETTGPDASRLASQVVIGDDVAEGARAYLLDGKTEPGTDEALRKHYEMLASLLPDVDEAARNGLDPRLKDAIANAHAAVAAAPLSGRLIHAKAAATLEPFSSEKESRISTEKSKSALFAKRFGKLPWKRAVAVVAAGMGGWIGGSAALGLEFAFGAAVLLAAQAALAAAARVALAANTAKEPERYGPGAWGMIMRFCLLISGTIMSGAGCIGVSNGGSVELLVPGAAVLLLGIYTSISLLTRPSPPPSSERSGFEAIFALWVLMGTMLGTLTFSIQNLLN